MAPALSPPQRPPTVALGRNARRLGRAKNESARGTLAAFFPLPIVLRAPVFSLQRSRFPHFSFTGVY